MPRKNLLTKENQRTRLPWSRAHSQNPDIQPVGQKVCKFRPFLLPDNNEFFLGNKHTETGGCEVLVARVGIPPESVGANAFRSARAPTFRMLFSYYAVLPPPKRRESSAVACAISRVYFPSIWYAPLVSLPPFNLNHFSIVHVRSENYRFPKWIVHNFGAILMTTLFFQDAGFYRCLIFRGFGCVTKYDFRWMVDSVVFELFLDINCSLEWV